MGIPINNLGKKCYLFKVSIFSKNFMSGPNTVWLIFTWCLLQIKLKKLIFFREISQLNHFSQSKEEELPEEH